MNEDYIQLKEGPSDPLGGASGEKRIFHAQFIGKTNNPDFPYTVANEVVAAFLGQALGLNLPTVLTYQMKGEVFALIQMIGNDPTMQQGPPATAKALQRHLQNHSWEVHGAIIFDLFIANNDRAIGPQRRNLKLDPTGRLLLYDQGNACFYRPRPIVGIVAGIPRLDAVEKDLTALFDMDHKENHYREFLTDWKLTEEWCQRIGTLPEYLIEAAVERIPGNAAVPAKAERDRLKGFLSKRRQYLFDHILKWQDRFPGLPSRDG